MKSSSHLIRHDHEVPIPQPLAALVDGAVLKPHDLHDVLNLSVGHDLKAESPGVTGRIIILYIVV